MNQLIDTWMDEWMMMIMMMMMMIMKKSHQLPTEFVKNNIPSLRRQKNSTHGKAVVLLRLAGRKGYVSAYLSCWHVVVHGGLPVGHRARFGSPENLYCQLGDYMVPTTY